mmetsp:Transcript_15261/g.38815  ORF Transcript_15261/g.38815 Transcript_15261/m.38815 type:complete len:222 (+) Transcript_15261:532-1197(+)
MARMRRGTSRTTTITTNLFNRSRNRNWSWPRLWPRNKRGWASKIQGRPSQRRPNPRKVRPRRPKRGTTATTTGLRGSQPRTTATLMICLALPMTTPTPPMTAHRVGLLPTATLTVICLDFKWRSRLMGPTPTPLPASIRSLLPRRRMHQRPRSRKKRLRNKLRASTYSMKTNVAEPPKRMRRSSATCRRRRRCAVTQSKQSKPGGTQSSPGSFRPPRSGRC